MSLSDILKDLTHNVHRLQQEDERRQGIPEFMNGMAELALHLVANPADRDSKRLKRFAAGTASSYEAAAAHIDLVFGSELEKLLNSAFEADEWQTVCRRRSALETVNEIYQGAVDEDFLLDPEDIDVAIRARADEEATPPVDARARETPASHWWWRLA